jgi:hypothetical protein
MRDLSPLDFFFCGMVKEKVKGYAKGEGVLNVN